MKKVIVVIAIIVAGLLYASSSRYGLNLGGYQLTFAPEKDELNKKMARFIQDIQFKDFAHAATFHTDKDQAEKDIPKMIERRFVVKPESLDIKSFDVVNIELMPTGKRAKIRTQWHVKLLNTKEKRDVEIVFYWHKENGVWYMDLQSSL